MHKTSSYFNPQETKYLINQSFDRVNSSFKKIKNVFSSDLIVKDKNSYHFISDLLTKVGSENQADKSIQKLLLNLIYSSEVLSQNAGLCSFVFTSALYREITGNASLQVNETDFNQLYQESFIKFSKILSDKNQIATKNDIKNTIEYICKDNPDVAEAVFQAILLAGLEGKILIENGKSNNFIIEKKTGYSFKLKPFKYFLNNSANPFWERRDCKILLVDGLVEKISELDQILQKAFELKQPMVIFARGFSEEVVATLKTNQERGLLDVLPVRIESDLQNINTINDLSIVCGKDAVSSLKGELLVYQNWDSLKSVEKIRITNSETLIENNSTRHAVSSHIKYLLEKRYEQSAIQDIEDLIDLRLKNLVSDSVIITLPDVSSFENDSVRIVIDNCLRSVKTIMNYGMTDLSGVFEEIDDTLFNELDKAIYVSIKKIGNSQKVFPTLSILTALKLSGPVCSLLSFAAGMVVQD